MSDNLIVIPCKVECATDDCIASYEGRVILRVSVPGFADVMIGGDGGVSLRGFAKPDMPDGWGMNQSQSAPPGLGSACVYCPEHFVKVDE